jgi:DNA-binding FadR family transcriptional regulator
VSAKYLPIQKSKASDLIVHEIWQLILAGELKPGDKLPPERELVGKFQVSKVTLREALRTLEAYGHITRKRGARGGSIVLDIAPTQGLNLLTDYLKARKYSLEQLIEARLLIEPLIAGMAASRITAGGIQKLQSLIREHRREFDTRGTSQYGWKLEPLLGALSGNAVLAVVAELFMRLELDMEFSIEINDLESTQEQAQYNREALRSHERIVNAVIAKDPAMARRAMSEHRREWARLIRKLYKSYHSGRPPHRGQKSPAPYPTSHASHQDLART